MSEYLCDEYEKPSEPCSDLERPDLWHELYLWEMSRAEKAEARVKLQKEMLNDCDRERFIAQARVQKLESELKKVNAVRIFAISKFGNEAVTTKVDGTVKFITLSELDREVMDRSQSDEKK